MDGIVNKEPILIVSGPTASGKSVLAVRLAQALNGDIVNIDSVQFYRGFEIGAAKLPLAERQAVVHHLLDIAGPQEEIDASKFTTLAAQIISGCSASGRVPIFCGGGGLYVTALLHGLATLPKGDKSGRAKHDEASSEDLYKRLVELDPIRAEKLHPNDRVRIIRALESFELSTEAPSAAQQRHGFNLAVNHALMLVIVWPRDLLYERIDSRSKKIIEEGLLDELSVLMQEYTESHQALKSIGYAEGREHLSGRLARDLLLPKISQHTRNFAKRQMTYWRNEPAKRGWIVRPRAEDQNVKEIDIGKVIGRSTLSGFRAFSWGMERLVKEVKQRLSDSFTANEVWYINGEALL